MSQFDRCNCWGWDNDRNDRRRQRHVHEITGSTAVFNEEEECHNHRFATVSGEAIRYGDSHVHEIKFCTDFADGHFHEFCGTSPLLSKLAMGNTCILPAHGQKKTVIDIDSRWHP